MLTNNGDYGYYIYTNGDGDVTVNMSGESITGHGTGIDLYDTVPGSTASSYDVTFNDSDISGNTDYGIHNEYAGTTINAKLNWWGDASGPGGEGPGSGDEVSANVIYCPWLDAAPPAGAPTSPNGNLVTNTDTGEMFCGIQPAIDDADTLNGHTIVASAGTYTETVVIDKEITLRGATYATNKNGYTVPPNYAWDPAVESIIQPPASSPDADVITVDDADNVTIEGFVIQALHRTSSGSRHLVTVRIDDENMENLTIRNNVIGANTNIDSQDGNKGRMNLYLDLNPYEGSMGLTNSIIAGNKIFGAEGNGNNVFIWGSYNDYTAGGPSPMTDTVIEDNEIYGSHRSGIETAGGISDLVIRNNTIHGNNLSWPGDAPDLKYGNGILLIRGASDKGDCNGFGPENITIEGNEIYDNAEHGIYMGPINNGVTITGNNIHDNGQDAVRVDLIGNYWNPDFDPNPGPYTCLGGSQDVSVISNTIRDNGAGAHVIGTPTNGFILDAENNWWGSVDGPEDISGTVEMTAESDCTTPVADMLNAVAEESGSLGDSVSENVDYCPWSDGPTVFNVYLPLVMHNYTPAPDLVVEDIITTANQVQVVIKNAGDQSIPDDEAYEFWIDLYLDPDHVPAYNEPWQDISDHGAAWGITWSGSSFSPSDPARQALPLEPGEVLTLTTGGDYYWASESDIDWPLSGAEQIYAQVDSINAETTYGGVEEQDETNNVTGPATP